MSWNEYIKKFCFIMCLICSVCICGCSDSENGKKSDISEDSKKVENKDEPESPADEMHDEDEIIGDPSEAPISEEITGISNTNGQQVLEVLSGYGFSVDEGEEAPDGSVSWFLQDGSYSCDMQTDANGKIYNVVFFDSDSDYIEFLPKCAGIFGSEVEAWTSDNINADTSTEIDSFSISISEGPGGHSLQICSVNYRDIIVGPDGVSEPGSPENSNDSMDSNSPEGTIIPES